MTTLAPEQLPNSNAQFIAYGAPTRIADPFGGDDAVSIRPQVFVRYYRGIKIRELAKPRNGADDTVRVVFDPESVGLTTEFGAFMNTDDPSLGYLREQQEQGNPVDVGIEYVRRKKAKDSKALISPLVPIHALRGANTPDGAGEKGAMLGAGGNHIRSIVALINGRRTTVAESDPREWAMLTGNRQGDLPPEGWKALLDKDDWTKVGAITPKGGVTPATQATAPQQQQPQQATAGEGIDMNVLAKVIGNEVRKGLKDYGEYLMRQDAASQGNTTSHAPASAVEGKPWNTWVNREHLNLGSYLVTGEGYALRWAYDYLDGIDDTTIRWTAAQELADASQRIADGVQSTAYNGEVRADRTSASFKESVLWVRFHVEHTAPFGTSEDFDFETWFNKVGRAATESLQQAEANAHQFLEERYPKAATQQQNAADTRQDATDTGQDEDRTPVVDAFCQMLTRAWTDRDAILNLAREAGEKGLMDVVVHANPHDGQFATAPFDGSQELTISSLTKRQYELLSQASQSAAPASAAQTPASPASPTQDEPQPQSTPTPAPQQGQTRSPQHLAAALAKATSEDEIGPIFQEARASNALMAEVAVQYGTGTFGLTPVRPGTEGAETMTLGAVFDAYRAAIDGQADSGEAEEQEPASQPQEVEQAAGEAPQQEGAAEPDPETSADPAPATASSDDKPLEADIADRALAATTVDEINALVTEATEADVIGNTVKIRAGSGPLGGFLKSRLKHIR